MNGAPGGVNDDGLEEWIGLQANFAAHAEAIGKVTISWSMCQLLVFALFYDLSGMTWENARAVFFALKSDATQREVTAALAQTLTGTRSPKKKIISAIDRLTQLAGERNATVHTMWQVSDEGLVPAQGISHFPKLDTANPQKQFELLDAKLTSTHAALVKAVVASAKHRPSRGRGAEAP